MKYKYKVGDKVKLKKKSDLMQSYDEVCDVTISEIDKGDDELPYLVSWRKGPYGSKQTDWVEAREIKGFASSIIIGGE